MNDKVCVICGYQLFAENWVCDTACRLYQEQLCGNCFYWAIVILTGRHNVNSAI